MDISKLPKFKRHSWIKVPPGTKKGTVFPNARETLSVEVQGHGRARYEGNCCGCNRPLFTDLDDNLTLGTHVFCLYDEFPDMPVCFECHSERKLYDALCAARPFRFRIRALVRKSGEDGALTPLEDTFRAASDVEAVDIFNAKWRPTHPVIYTPAGSVRQLS